MAHAARAACAGIALALLALPGSASAHQVLPSALELALAPRAVEATLHLPAEQLGLALATSWGDPSWTALPDAAERFDESFRARLREYVGTYLSLRDERGTAWRMEVAEPRWTSESDAPFVVVEARFTPSDDHAARTLVVHDEVVSEEVVSHRTIVSVRDLARGETSAHVAGTLRFTSRELSLAGSAVEASPSVDGEAARPSLAPAEASEAAGAGAMLALGARHIAEGLDHLLFVLVLLLAAPLVPTAGGRRWGVTRGTWATLAALARLVTAFTLGHSVTLALGALGWVRLPSAPVETLVAISIAVGAVHAARPVFAGREVLVAGAFGLVHGLAFASTLEGFGLHGGALAIALGAFNLGIELVQLAVVLALAPLLVMAARLPRYTQLRTVCAALALVAATSWALERTLGLRTPIADALDAAAAAPLALGAAVIAALVAWIAVGRTSGRAGAAPA